MISIDRSMLPVLLVLAFLRQAKCQNPHGGLAARVDPNDICACPGATSPTVTATVTVIQSITASPAVAPLPSVSTVTQTITVSPSDDEPTPVTRVVTVSVSPIIKTVTNSITIPEETITITQVQTQYVTQVPSISVLAVTVTETVISTQASEPEVSTVLVTLPHTLYATVTASPMLPTSASSSDVASAIDPISNSVAVSSAGQGASTASPGNGIHTSPAATTMATGAGMYAPGVHTCHHNGACYDQNGRQVTTTPPSVSPTLPACGISTLVVTVYDTVTQTVLPWNGPTQTISPSAGYSPSVNSTGAVAMSATEDSSAGVIQTLVARALPPGPKTVARSDDIGLGAMPQRYY